LDATIFSDNKKLQYLYLGSNKINALSNKMFQQFYNTLLALDFNYNLCINKNFASGSLINATQQQAFESALEICNKLYVANNPGNSSSLLRDLANLLQNF
jgi:hypothetical protein